MRPDCVLPRRGPCEPGPPRPRRGRGRLDESEAAEGGTSSTATGVAETGHIAKKAGPQSPPSFRPLHSTSYIQIVSHIPIRLMEPRLTLDGDQPTPRLSARRLTASDPLRCAALVCAFS